MKILTVLSILTLAIFTSPANAADKLALELKVANAQSASTAEIKPEIIITNNGDKEILVSSNYIDNPTYYLELRKDGKILNKIPTAVPAVNEKGASSTLYIPPGMNIDITFRDLPVTTLTPGKYQVRFNYENADASKGHWTGKWVSDWVDFEITK